MANGKIKNIIPNTITAMNIISGFIGIIFILRYNQLVTGILFMFIAGFFDLCDGLSARLLNANSDIGHELDSLCDVVSFGILPGTLMFDLLNKICVNMTDSMTYIPLIAFIIPAFAALRLAKFNVNQQKLSVFSGLSSPGAACFFASVVQNSHTLPFLLSIKTYYALIIVIAIILVICILMISNVKFLSLKFHSFSFKDNYITYIFYAISITIFIIFGVNALLYILLFYMILSLIVCKATD